MSSDHKLKLYWRLSGIQLLLMLISVQYQQNIFCQAQARTLITRPPQNQKIIKGSTAKFYCGVSHDANIEVTWKWTHNRLLSNIAAEIISNSRRSVAVDGTLTIHDVSYKDQGYYSCQVESTGGNDVKSVTLTVIELPRAPIITSVRLHPTDTRAAIVKWHPGFDGNTLITGFKVQHRAVPYGHTGNRKYLGWLTVDSNVHPEVREATVTGLRPARYYQFRVITSNEVGDGSPSSPKPDPALKMPKSDHADFLMFSEALSMKSIDLDDEDGKNPPVFTIKNNTFHRNVIGLSFDYDHEIIFYSDILRWDIQAVSFDGTNIQVVVGDVGQVEGLAFEKLNGDIYWTSYTYSSISKINVYDALSKKTRGPEVIVHLSNHDLPRAIVVDGCLELVYWTNWNKEKPRIQRSKLTGEDVEDIIVKDIVTPNGLTIDHRAKKLYWSDARLDKIERCDMDGSNRVKIVTFEPQHSFSLAVYDNYLFWTDWIHRAVIRANKYDGTGVVKIRDNLGRQPMGIIVIAEESENCVINKCYGDNYGCQDKCYTDVTGQAFCQCTYGSLKGDEKTCASRTQIIRPPQDQKIMKGSTATFYCGVSHDPVVQVRWTWTHRKLHTDTDVAIIYDTRRSVADDGTLTINKVKNIDNGDYICQVTSVAGNDTKTVSLKVIARTQLIRPPVDQTIISGSAATLYCGVSHDPSIRVTWTWTHRKLRADTGVEVLHDSRHSVADDGTLTIREVNYIDIGDYTCHVTSTVGNDTKTVSLTVIELPKPPYAIAVSNIVARSVVLMFLPGFDGNTNITLWIVEALEGDATEWKTIYTVQANKDTPSARFLQVENLKPYTHYKLRIKAENIVGQSGPSGPTRLFQTLKDIPGAHPGSVRVRALNATALRVTWSPLSKGDWNGELRGYKIYYKLKEGVGNFQAVDLENSINLAVLGGLEEWMQYEVKMQAYNEVGESGYSPITTGRTRESVPSEGPQNVHAVPISSTSVNVSWGDVPILQQNGMILGFKVAYRPSETGIPTKFKDVSGNGTNQVLLENLSKFVTYEIRVLAYTRMGDGPPSDPEVAVQTHADVPGPPDIIWFPDVSYSDATVVWEPPSEPNGIITGYMVSYKLRDNPYEYVNSSVLSSETFNYTVGSLQRESFYEFRLTAKTTVGWGEAATVEVYTTENRSAPDNPSQPAIDQVQARSVTISWTRAPSNSYGPLRNFTVQYYKKGQSWISINEPIPPNVTTCIVQGLRPNAEYRFKVAATNDIGTSPLSVQSDSVRTLEDYPEEAPRHVKVDRLTTTSVKVSWKQPFPDTWNGDLLGYVLMYRQAENSNYMEVEIPVDSTEKILPNLVKFVDYEFLVKAFNTIGESPASTPVTVFVGEAAPTAAPVNIVTKAVNSTEIHVTWQPPPPETQNGDLFGYRISYWRKTDPESTAKQVTQREQSVILVGLDMYTEYGISIQAINVAGEGPKSKVKYEKTLEGLPGKPASLTFWNVTYISLDVHWEAPVKPNGRIINYELSYFATDSFRSKLVKLNVSDNVHQINIKDLRENVTYLFRLSASTVIGQGERIEQNVTIGPQHGSPEAPYQLKVSMEPNGQKLLLQWMSGSEGQLPVFGHLIQAQQVYSRQWTHVKQIGNEPRSEINLLQLKPDTAYVLRVIALNPYGMSPYSAPSQVFKTPAKAPSEPKRFLVFSQTTSLEIIHLDDDTDYNSPQAFALKNSTFIRRVVGLAFDYENELIFYNDVLRGDIQAVSFGGTDIRVVVEGVNTVEGLAYERMNGDLYMTSYTNSTISKINVDDALNNKTREPEVLIELSEDDHPRGIVVDICWELIYWTNWNREKPKIQRMNLRGEHVEDIIKDNIRYPNDLTVDHRAKKLYWLDAGLDKIERCDMDGSNRVVIVDSEPQHTFGLAVHHSFLFWTDWLNRSVVRANKYDGSDVVWIRKDMEHQPMGIIAVAEDSENCMINKCHGDNYGCQDKCYTDVTGQAFCQCLNGKLNTDGKTCACK